MSFLMKLATASAVAIALPIAAAAAIVSPTNSSGLIAGNNLNPTGVANVYNYVDGLGVYASGFTLTPLTVNRPDTMNGDLSVSYDQGNTSGSWTWTGAEAIEIVVYKAANEYVVHYHQPGLFTNMWDTDLLGIHNNQGRPQAISHISAYTVSVSSVPLPAGGLLLLTALGGLALRRKS
jgi:hypothetical protein